MDFSAVHHRFPPNSAARGVMIEMAGNCATYASKFEWQAAGWCFFKITNPRENGHPKRKRIFQPSIVRRYVSFREGKVLGFFGANNMKKLWLFSRNLV